MLSMWPLISPDDQIGEIKPQDNYATDDIVVFKQHNLLIAHRIVYIAKSNGEIAYITRGDNNLKVDQLVKKSQVLGKVISIIHHDKIVKIEKFYARQSKNYLDEYSKFSSEASRVRLPFIILKGLPIYLKYTSNYPRHYIFDLDILIHPKDVNKVLQVARNLGYQIPKDYGESSEFNLTKIINGLPLSLDIHLEPAIAFTKFPSFNRLIPETKMLEHEIWKTSHNHFLSPTYQYLYLLLHLFHHSLEGTKRWDLIGQVEKSGLVSPAKCGAIIKHLRLTGFVYPLLLLMKKYYPQNSKSLRLFSMVSPKLKIKTLSTVIGFYKRPWAQSHHLVNRLELLAFVLIISSLSLFAKVKILTHSIISLDFKRSKNWITSSSA